MESAGKRDAGETVKLITLIAILMLPSCRCVTYADTAGRRVTYTNVGFDTKIGTLTLKAPDGSTVQLQNYSSTDEAALAVIGAAIAKIPAVP